MPKADGSILIQTSIDVSRAEKDLENLKTAVAKTESKIDELEEAKKGAEEKSVFSAAELDAEKKKLADMKKQLEEIRAVAKDATLSPSVREEAKAQIPTQREEIADQRARVRMLQTEYNRLETSVERYSSQIRKATKKLEKQQEEAGALAKGINSVSKASIKMADAQEKAEKSMRKFGLRLREVVRSALVFTLITQALAKFREWMSKVLKTNEDARQSFSRLKGALLTAAQPLVEILIPAAIALADALTKLLMVAAQITSALFGTTVEQSKEAAESLNKETEALEGVNGAADDAAKSLASFDEINQLGGKDGNGYIAPDFSSLESAELPEWLTSLTATMSDIIFKWENLTAEDVLEKVVASIGSIAGAVIGFTVGGVGGAAIGMTVGASLSALLSNLNFDENGTLDTEEILSSLCVALNTAAGTIIGFSVGGLKGAAIGAVIGASSSVGIRSLLFDGDGTLDGEEVLTSIVGALTTVAGAVLGFKVGGPKGAAIGVSVATGVTSLIGGLLFNNDGQIGGEEVLGSLCSAAYALIGGVVGFSVGGPKGAAIGATVGSGVGVLLSTLLFDNDGVLSKEEVAKTASAALGALAGGIIGFSVGGPGGAFIGATIGAAATVALSGMVFDGNGVLDTKELLKSLCAAAGAIVGAGIAFAVLGTVTAGGAVIGLTVGAILTITLLDVFTEGFNTVQEKVPNFTGIGPDYSWLFKSKEVSLPSSSVAQGSVIPKGASFSQDYTSLMEKFFPSGGFGSISASGGSAQTVETTVVLEVDKRELGRVTYNANKKENARFGVALVED